MPLPPTSFHRFLSLHAARTEWSSQNACLDKLHSVRAACTDKTRWKDVGGKGMD